MLQGGSNSGFVEIFKNNNFFLVSYAAALFSTLCKTCQF